MAHLYTKQGLNLPIPGAPQIGPIETAPPPHQQALDFRPFQKSVRPKLLVDVGARVLLGQPLIEDSKSERRWVSPASGTIHSILRGDKRILEAIIIDADFEPEVFQEPAQDDLILYLAKTGLLAHIRMRPFHLPAHPHMRPRSIFVKGLESAPFTPSPETQIEGREEFFRAGLKTLARIAPVHLITRPNSTLPQENVQPHTAEGPHPISHPSVHIERIDPIRKATDVVWTVDTLGVLAIGRQLSEGRSDIDPVVGLGGEGFLPSMRRFFRFRPGAFTTSFLSDKLNGSPLLISGDPLMGRPLDGFLGWGHTVLSALPTETKRKFLHFFRLFSPYTATRTYCAKPIFNDLMHGEERAFIDPNVYDKVMPLHVPTVPFLKALITENYERAEELGLLEVAPEDFALPAFICPSKTDMVPLVERALLKYAGELFSE